RTCDANCESQMFFIERDAIVRSVLCHDNSTDSNSNMECSNQIRLVAKDWGKAAEVLNIIRG
ncbi:unnamed protein product, partial [Allacma fusca]